MIKEFVERFMANKDRLEVIFRNSHPDDYKDIVKAVVGVIANGQSYGEPSQDRIHEINDGDYQGTLVYVTGACGYQPNDYWYVKVGYGSCSGCDTLESIREFGDKVSDQAASDYMTLALHIVQGIKKMGEETV